jgi:hypothetical protein
MSRAGFFAPSNRCAASLANRRRATRSFEEIKKSIAISKKTRVTLTRGEKPV